MRSKLSLKQRGLNYLAKKGDWTNGGELERLALNAGYKASNISRRMREAYEDHLIDRKEEKGAVWYKTLSPLTKVNYYRTLPNGEKELLFSKWE